MKKRNFILTGGLITICLTLVLTLFWEILLKITVGYLLMIPVVFLIQFPMKNLLKKFSKLHWPGFETGDGMRFPILFVPKDLSKNLILVISSPIRFLLYQLFIIILLLIFVFIKIITIGSYEIPWLSFKFYKFTPHLKNENEIGKDLRFRDLMDLAKLENSSWNF